MARLKPVKRSKQFDDLIETLSKTNTNGQKLFNTIRELLCFAAMLGYAEDKKVPLNKSLGMEDISYQQFEFNDSNDFIYLIAVAETSSTDCLKEDSDIDMVEIFEEYANGGLESISSWMSEFQDYDGYRALIQGLLKRKYIEVGEADDVSIDDVKKAFQF